MSGWIGYSAEDFLLFSPRVYWRLLELHNASLWPLHLVMVVLAAGIVLGLRQRWPAANRAACTALALIWVWVGWSFLAQRYATINWAADYAAWAFYVQALLIAGVGGIGGRVCIENASTVARSVGIALIGYAVLLHPLVAVATGRGIASAEVFGIMPDPTAIATLGIIVMMHRAGAAWLLLPIPALWCLVSAMTLYAMGAPEGWLPLGAAALAVAVSLASSRRGRVET